MLKRDCDEMIKRFDASVSLIYMSLLNEMNFRVFCMKLYASYNR